MALFKRKPKLPEGTIVRDDQVMVPVDQVPAEFAEGEHAFTIMDEWQGELGAFVGINATAVREAVEQKWDSKADQRELAMEELDNPAHWLGGDPPEDAKIMVCRLDESTGKLSAGPALADLVMGIDSFRIYDIEGETLICVNRETAIAEIGERIDAMEYEISTEEHEALTYEVMDDPAHWTGGSDDEGDEPDDDVPRFSFYPFDRTTGRIARRG